MIGNISNAVGSHKPITRRRFLQVGGLGLLAGGIPSNFNSLQASDQPNESMNVTHSIVPITSNKKDPGISLIVISLQGGFSHFDTVDPREENVDALIKGPFKRTKTSATKEVFT